jgi:hypothetical protein
MKKPPDPHYRYRFPAEVIGALWFDLTTFLV